jgi:hypothetical protein
MDFSPHPCVEQDQDRCHDGSQSHQSTLRRQSEQPAQSVRVTRSRWGRQKRCKADRAAQQSPHSSFSLESIRLIVRRKPNRPGQHLSQKLTAIGDVRREQGSPVGHALPDVPFNQRSIDSSALHGLTGGEGRDRVVAALLPILQFDQERLKRPARSNRPREVGNLALDRRPRTLGRSLSYRANRFLRTLHHCLRLRSTTRKRVPRGIVHSHDTNSTAARSAVL